MVGQSQSEALADSFESMAEWSMSDIVNKRGRQCAMLSSFPLFTGTFAHDCHKLSGSFENAEAVRKPRVRCARINKFGKTKLSNSAEPLQRPSLKSAPKRAFKMLIGVEFDQIV